MIVTCNHKLAMKLTVRFMLKAARALTSPRGILAIALALPLSSPALAGNLGPDLELDCPCTFSTDSITSAVLEAGVINIRDTATGPLLLRVWAHSTPNLNDEPGTARLLTERAITDSLAANSAIAKTSFNTGLLQAVDGTYYVTFRLIENNAVIDGWGSPDQITLLEFPGGGTDGSGSVYFDGVPSHSIDGDTLTLNIPAITNVSPTSDFDIEVILFATETSEYFGQSGFNLATQDYATTLTSNTQISAISPTFTWVPPNEGFDYYHIAVVNSANNITLVYQTINAPEGETLPTRSFTARSLDYLQDSDADGVADVNETLMGTDPNSASSTPGSSTIDVLALYSEGVTTLYNGDPDTRIDHIMAFSNQVLSDSGVDISLRLVDSRELAMDETRTIDDWLDDANNRANGFASLDSLRDETGADLIVLYRPFDDGNTCGFAAIGGFEKRGDFSNSQNLSRAHTPVFIDADSCEDNTTMHEFGHLMGLGHSFKQDETGTFDWSRGHGVDDSFSTIMGYGTVFNTTEVPFFSSPDLMQCDGGPCGIDIDQAEAAHAVKSLNITRFQVAAYKAALADSDNDGVVDNLDEFPNDASESVDTDKDGIGNNADTDDDDDGMPDTFEVAGSLNPLVDDAAGDLDGDGATNLEEFNTDTDPNDANSIDACLDMNAVAAVASDSALPVEKVLFVANPGSNSNQQSFLRFVNNNNSSTDVEVYGIDDNGARSDKGPVTFTLDAEASKQLKSSDLENGNTSKGLTSNLCDGKGKWQLVVRSAQAIEVMGLIRTPDGFLTSLNDSVPVVGGDNLVYFANPGSNTNQQTFLRVVNLTDNSNTVTITAIDDTGLSSEGTVTLTLGANESKQMTAQDLENGNTDKGLTGNLDNGTGKWRLVVSSALDLQVMSMIRSTDGFLTNQSGMVDENQSGDHVIFFANPASDTFRQTFLRIINTSGSSGTVTIAGVDDNGDAAPGGDVTFSLEANAAKQVTAGDLENGNAGKGLTGALGSGDGRWRLTVSSGVDLQVMSLIRTPDGFLTNLSRTTPVAGGINDVFIFNPASNTNQRSSLRLVNSSAQQGSVTVNGFDDSGMAGGAVTFSIPADSGMTVTSQDLENGNTDLGLSGALGDGTGKWRLHITSDVDLQVQSLLDTPSGFLTNLSRTIE
jgi:peptidyl-Asp metalloendopeptidase